MSNINSSLQYEPPVKDIAGKQMEALKRVRERKQQQRRFIAQCILCIYAPHVTIKNY